MMGSTRIQLCCGGRWIVSRFQANDYNQLVHMLYGGGVLTL
jgi:hypothetical protein